MGEVMQELEEIFERNWNVRGAHNLSMPKESNIDWKSICHEFFMQGVESVIAHFEKVIKKKPREGG